MQSAARGTNVPRAFASPAALQGAFYLVGGAWPLVSYATFVRVTGPKREPWLVRTVGLLTVVIGTALLLHARRGDQAAAAPLGIGTALSYAAIDTWYAGPRRRISPVYLLDALAEAGLIGVWLAWIRSRGRA